MNKITNIKFLKNHQIQVNFNNGLDKILFCEAFIGDDTLTSPLREENYFHKAKIYENGRGIYWPNQFDICADFIYAE